MEKVKKKRMIAGRSLDKVISVVRNFGRPNLRSWGYLSRGLRMFPDGISAVYGGTWEGGLYVRVSSLGSEGDLLHAFSIDASARGNYKSYPVVEASRGLFVVISYQLGDWERQLRSVREGLHSQAQWAKDRSFFDVPMLRVPVSSAA